MIDNFSLKPGEKLDFSLFFQVSKTRRINLGEAKVSFERLEIPEREKEDLGKLTVDLTIDSKFEVINSHFQGFEIIDTKFNSTIRSNYVIKDKKRTVYQKINFDPSKSKVNIDETFERNDGRGERPLTNVFLKGPPQFYDYLALLYKLRSLELRQSEIVSLAVLYYNHLYPILVEYQFNEKKEHNNTKVECRVYRLRSNRGKLPPLRKQFELQSASVWISNDENRLPIYVEINTQKGNLVAELKRFLPPKKSDS
ncbi:MAG: DUF3108 domain-containing protein [Candidatus Aminicenantaceae bacterium]